MKRIIPVFALVLLIGGGAGVFANGQPEKNGQPGTTGATQSWGAEKEITGQLYLSNLVHPVVKAGATSYELLVPRNLAYREGLKEGQTITVKGNPYLGQLPAELQPAAGETLMRVNSATINGKTYDLAQLRDLARNGFEMMGRGQFGPGPGPGMMGDGYGRGPMMGYGPGPGWDDQDGR